MTDTSMRNTELVSALVDGQLRGDEFSHALAHLETSSEARQSWHAYHVLGDVHAHRPVDRQRQRCRLCAAPARQAATRGRAFGFAPCG